MGLTSIAPPLAGNVLASAADGFVVAEWQDAGGPPGPSRWIAPLHLHRNDDEAWYVLEGTLRVRMGNDEVEARPGFRRAGTARDPPYLLLQCRTRPVALSARDDFQYLSLDPGNPRAEREIRAITASGI